MICAEGAGGLRLAQAVRHAGGAIAVAVALLVPAIAEACAVCFSGSPRVRIAFFNMTIMMSLLPLAIIVGGVWALRRSSRMVLAEEFDVTDNSLQPAVPVPDSKTPRSE